ILLADPSRDVSQPGVGRIGSVDPTDEGSLGGVRVGSSLRPSTVDICAVGDAVCTGVGIDFATHIDGYRAVEPAVLEFVDRFVAGSTLARRPIR
ncbi:MAG: hypothetical protein KDB69_10750, partial [Acidimicrobiia bacterium]|nr:hypothetical protein [Acidimicrobiia bacterium]